MTGDHYRTIAAACEFRQKIERSDFLAIAVPVAAEEDLFAELARLQKRYFDATHHCWAFRLFDGRARSSDAGEPSGTAGKPIAMAIEGAGLHDVGVIVIRWFGGIKLGTGGLARAYGDTAAGALAAAKPVDRYLYTRFEVVVPFSRLNDAYRLIDPPNVLLAGEEFGETNVFRFDVRVSTADNFAFMLRERRFVILSRADGEG